MVEEKKTRRRANFDSTWGREAGGGRRGKREGIDRALFPSQLSSPPLPTPSLLSANPTTSLKTPSGGMATRKASYGSDGKLLPISTSEEKRRATLSDGPFPPLTLLPSQLVLLATLRLFTSSDSSRLFAQETSPRSIPS